MQYVIKQTTHPLWSAFIAWANENSSEMWTGGCFGAYYGFSWNGQGEFNCCSNLTSFNLKPVILITLEQWQDLINGKTSFYEIY